jgi:hypothetical protein
VLLTREKLWSYTIDAVVAMDVNAEDTEALTLICLHVEPHVYPYVTNAVKAKEAWDELAEVFKDKT